MKAIVCQEFSPLERLKLLDVAAPIAAKEQVVIDIEAAGVNFPDGLLVQGLYQIKPPTPFSPGSEIAGTIAAIGEGVSHLVVGQRVIAFCMLGGFAEQVAVNAHAVMPLIDAIPSTEAAGLLTAHATAHHGLKQRANLQQGETLLVTGAAGGTGLAAVQIGKAMGAKVIAVCSSDEKLAVAKENGADVLINLNDGNLKELIKQATIGQGVDVVYECVGGDSFKACLSNMAWGGRLLVIGFAGGDIPQIPANHLLVKGCSVLGVFWGTFTHKQPQQFVSNMQQLMQWYAEKKVRVVIDQIFALKETPAAINKVMSRQVKGKVIINIKGSA